MSYDGPVSAAPPDPRPESSFELSGGALCLDFANTLEDRLGDARERLRAYPDLLEFAVQTGSLEPETAESLARRGRRRPARAAEALRRAISLRETLFRIFAALAAGGPPPPAELRRLNRALPGALARLTLVGHGDRIEWAWTGPAEALDRPLWPVLRSAAELLTSDDRERVRECDSRTCSWLFLDCSRNRSRRWCDMKTCGNRAKARRHYRRRRGLRGAG